MKELEAIRARIAQHQRTRELQGRNGAWPQPVSDLELCMAYIATLHSRIEALENDTIRLSELPVATPNKGLRWIDLPAGSKVGYAPIHPEPDPANILLAPAEPDELFPTRFSDEALALVAKQTPQDFMKQWEAAYVDGELHDAVSAIESDLEEERQHLKRVRAQWNEENMLRGRE